MRRGCLHCAKALDGNLLGILKTIIQTTCLVSVVFVVGADQLFLFSQSSKQPSDVFPVGIA